MEIKPTDELDEILERTSPDQIESYYKENRNILDNGDPDEKPRPRIFGDDKSPCAALHLVLIGRKASLRQATRF